jgi:hypothetical protein
MERVLTDDERDERWNERHRSLQQLEPLPVETVEAIDDLNDVQPDLPDTLGEVPPAPKRTSFLGLGGLRDLFGQSRGHGAAWWCTFLFLFLFSFGFPLFPFLFPRRRCPFTQRQKRRERQSGIAA